VQLHGALYFPVLLLFPLGFSASENPNFSIYFAASAQDPSNNNDHFRQYFYANAYVLWWYSYNLFDIISSDLSYSAH